MHFREFQRGIQAISNCLTIPAHNRLLTNKMLHASCNRLFSSFLIVICISFYTSSVVFWHVIFWWAKLFDSPPSLFCLFEDPNFFYLFLPMWPENKQLVTWHNCAKWDEIKIFFSHALWLKAKLFTLVVGSGFTVDMLYTGWLEKKLDSTLEIYFWNWVYQANYWFIIFDKGAN